MTKDTQNPICGEPGWNLEKGRVTCVLPYGHVGRHEDALEATKPPVPTAIRIGNRSSRLDDRPHAR